MAEITPFDQLTWLTLLYLWTATEPADFADSLCEVRGPVRAELAASLNRKAAHLDAVNKSTFHHDTLKRLGVPVATADHVTCEVCGAALLMAPANDGRGGKVYAYQCTAEMVVDAGGRVRQVKRCPDIGRVGRQDPILSDASVQKQREGES